VLGPDLVDALLALQAEGHLPHPLWLPVFGNLVASEQSCLLIDFGEVYFFALYVKVLRHFLRWEREHSGTSIWLLAAPTGDGEDELALGLLEADEHEPLELLALPQFFGEVL